jgi:hypothetical protein
VVKDGRPDRNAAGRRKNDKKQGVEDQEARNLLCRGREQRNPESLDQFPPPTSPTAGTPTPRQATQYYAGYRFRRRVARPADIIFPHFAYNSGDLTRLARARPNRATSAPYSEEDPGRGGYQGGLCTAAVT